MNDLIDFVTGRLSIERNRAELGAGVILRFIEGSTAPAGFAGVLQAVPGAAGWMAQASEGSGEGAAELVHVVSALVRQGFDLGAAIKILSHFLEGLEVEMGPAFQSIARSVPFIAEVLGPVGAARRAG